VKHAIIGHRYAQAFLATVSPQDYPSLHRDVEQLTAVFANHPELISIISSRVVHPEKRDALIRTLLDGTTHHTTWENLFGILKKKAKIEIFPAILRDLEEKVLAAQGKMKILLTLAHKQSDEMIEKIRTIVEKEVQAKVLFEVTIQPQVLGGFVAESSSLRIDGSIQHNLIQFKRQLLT
jgi:F-type H+-transporting ATPase subunit delta